MRAVLRLAGSLTVLAVFVGAAPAVAARAEGLTPEAAVALALSRSDELRSAQLKVEVVRVEETAFELENPELQLGHRSLNGLAGSQVDPFDDSQLGVGWSLPALGDLGVKQAIGARVADADLRDVDDVAAAVAVEVRLLHAQVLSLRAEHALAVERVTLLERVAALQTQRLSEQVATALDAGLTSLDLLDARAELADLAASLVRAEQRLARLVGEKTPLALVPSTTPPCALPADPVEAVLARARERSPRLRAIALREEALVWRERGAWLRSIPWLDRLQLGTIVNGDVTELRARLDIAIPVFEPLNPELRIVSLERERLAAEHRAAERDLEERLRAAFDRLDGFVRLVDVYADATARIEASQETVARSLAAEVVDTLRVASVQERVLNARRQALRARYKCDEAGIAFSAAAGTVATTTTPPPTATTPAAAPPG